MLPLHREARQEVAARPVQPVDNETCASSFQDALRLLNASNMCYTQHLVPIQLILSVHHPVVETAQRGMGLLDVAAGETDQMYLHRGSLVLHPKGARD